MSGKNVVLSFMAAIHVKKKKACVTKGWKIGGTDKKHLNEHVAAK